MQVEFEVFVNEFLTLQIDFKNTIITFIALKVPKKAF